MHDAGYFQVGGTLPGAAPSYVPRQADEDLYQALRAGELCYVLDTRQVGKSSLMVRAAERLRDDGLAAMHLDLSSLGGNLSAEQWYFGLLDGLAAQIGLADEAEQFWLANERLGYARRWFNCLYGLVVPHLNRPLTIFVDEIDAVRNLPFCADEFFALIRESYNRRATAATRESVTFCLLGVALPSDLIRDPSTTPFNVGRRIEVRDFVLDEMHPLAGGLKGDPSERAVQLKRAWHWTAGHPYLSQKLCDRLAQEDRSLSAREVDALCKDLFLLPQALEQEDNLQFVGRQLLHDADSRADILSLLDHILRAGRRTVPDSADALLNRLRLAGIITAKRTVVGTEARVRNRVYERAFGKRWIAANMPGAEVQRQRRAVRQGVIRASLIWATVLALLGMTVYASQRAAVEAGGRTAAERRARDEAALKTKAQKQLDSARQTLREVNSAVAAKTRTVGDLTGRIEEEQKELSNRERRMREAAASFRTLQSEFAALADRVGKEAGPVASALSSQSGSELDAAKYAIKGVEPFLDANLRPSPEAAQGLADAATVGIYRHLLITHPGGVTCADFDHGEFRDGVMTRPGGHRLLTAGHGRFCYVWDVSTGNLLQRLAVLAEADADLTIDAAAFSADDRLIVTADDTGRVKLWDAGFRGLVQTRPLLTVDARSSHFTTFAISGDLQWLATTGPGNAALLWDLKPFNTASRSHKALGWLWTREREKPAVLGAAKPDGNGAPHLWSIAFSPNAKWLATGSGDGRVRVWDVASHRILQLYAGHAEGHQGGAVHSVHFSSFSDSILSGGADRTVQLWDWKTGRFALDYPGHTGDVWDLDLLWNNEFVATTGADRTVAVWPFSTNRAPLFVLQSHADTVWSVRCCRDPNLIATASADRTADVWRFSAPVYAYMNGAASASTFAGDSQTVLCSGTDGQVHLWDWPTNRHAGHLYPSIGPCRFAEVSRDQHWVVSAHDNGAACIWKFKHPDDNPNQSPLAVLNGHPNRVNTAAFSPDASRIVTAAEDGHVRLWTCPEGKFVREIAAHAGGANSAFFSPDGGKIVTAGRDGAVRIWDATEGALRRTLLPAGRRTGPKPPLDYPAMAAFSPDGQFVVSADRDHLAYVWRVADGALVHTLAGPTGAVTCAAFSPDGTQIAGSSVDRSAYIWDIAHVQSATVQPYYRLRHNPDALNWLAYSPDGRWLAVAGREGTCRIYPATLAGLAAQVRDLASRTTIRVSVP
ncbi:MAG TPA: AAA-like domain-containing protein [Chthonomonadaceae bacterium]|nr:AAA-like domain-containing protein [Chthonomonadaceae bacterium]